MERNRESAARSPGVRGAKVDAHHSADVLLLVVIVGVRTADHQQKQAQYSHAGITVELHVTLLRNKTDMKWIRLEVTAGAALKSRGFSHAQGIKK